MSSSDESVDSKQKDAFQHFQGLLLEDVTRGSETLLNDTHCSFKADAFISVHLEVM